MGLSVKMMDDHGKMIDHIEKIINDTLKMFKKIVPETGHSVTCTDNLYVIYKNHV